MSTLLRHWNALHLGLLDGWREPHSLESGITYPDPDLSDRYDRGVNLGQSLKMTFLHLRAALR